MSACSITVVVSLVPFKKCKLPQSPAAGVLPAWSRLEVKMMGWPAVPRATNAPLARVRLIAVSKVTTTPDSIVSVAPFSIEMSAVAWYGLCANVQTVLVLITPDTIVAACVVCTMLRYAVTISSRLIAVLIIDFLTCTCTPKFY